VDFLREQRSFGELSNLLAQGRVDEALIGAEKAGRRLGTVWSVIFAEAAADTAAFFSEKTKTLIDFDLTSPDALRQMQMQQLRLTRVFSQDQIKAARVAVIRSMQAGDNSTRQALLLSASFGLTSKQIESLFRYRILVESLSAEALQRDLRDEELRGTLREAIQNKDPLTKTQISEMVRRYQETLLDFRRNTIARSEALSAVNAGVYEMYNQAISANLIDPGSVIRKWNTRKEGRVRDTRHSKMQGQSRDFFDFFQSSSGARLQFPGDMNASIAETANCLCYLSTRFSTY